MTKQHSNESQKKSEKITVLTQTVSQDYIYEFFLIFDRLGSKAQKIFRNIQFFCQKYPTAFPSQGKIAECSDCSREYVNKIMKRFFELGWLMTESRGNRRSKIIYMDDMVLSIDTMKKNYWKRIEFTREFTHKLSYTPAKYDSRSIVRNEERELIKKRLEAFGFSGDELMKMQTLPWHIVEKMLNVCKSIGPKVMQRDKIKSKEDLPKYMVGIALNLARQAGIRPEWGWYRNVKLHGAA